MKKRVTINLVEKRARQKLNIVQPDRDIARKKDGPFPPTNGGDIGTQDCVPNQGGSGGEGDGTLLIECRPTCQPEDVLDKIIYMSCSIYALRAERYPYIAAELPAGKPGWWAYIDGDGNTTGGFPGDGIISFSEPVALAGISIVQETMEFSVDIGGPGKAVADIWHVDYWDGTQWNRIGTNSGSTGTNQSMSWDATSATTWRIIKDHSPYTGADASLSYTSWSLYSIEPIGVTRCSGCEHAEVITPSTGQSVGTVSSGSTGIDGSPLSGQQVLAQATYISGNSWWLPSSPKRVISLTVDSLPTREWVWDGAQTITFETVVPSASEVFVIYVL